MRTHGAFLFSHFDFLLVFRKPHTRAAAVLDGRLDAYAGFNQRIATVALPEFPIFAYRARRIVRHWPR